METAARKFLIDSELDDELSLEVSSAKFKNFAKEKFQDYVRYEVDYLELVKDSARGFAYNLPDEIGDFLIKYQYAPYFLTSDSPVLAKAEEAFRGTQKGSLTVVSNYNEIKKFYTKWLSQKTEKEKQYFALSTINLIERNGNERNFLKLILHASILTFDDRIFAPDKAAELLTKSEEILEDTKMPEDAKTEVHYLICIYKGFANLTKTDYERANECFRDALVHKPNGITALFYNAVAERKLGATDNALALISKVLDYDRTRLHFALDGNNLNLFHYFLRNAAIYNVFTEKEFSTMLKDIDFLISSSCHTDTDIIGELRNNITILDELDYKKFYSKEIKTLLAFVEKYIQKYNENKNALLGFAVEKLKDKMEKIIQLILRKIRLHYEKIVEEELKYFDEAINENNEEMVSFKEEKDEQVERMKKRLEDILKRVEEHRKDIISRLEYRIENLTNDSKFDPTSSFNNTMVFNAIISLLVFIVGGFTDGFINLSGSDVGNMGSLMAATMIAGLKWGGIAFVIGIMISMFSAASAIWERTSEKQKLVRDIAYVKSQKSKEVEVYKKDVAKKIEAIEQEYKERIEALEKENERVKDERQARQKELNEKNEKIIEETSERLLALVH